MIENLIIPTSVWEASSPKHDTPRKFSFRGLRIVQEDQLSDLIETNREDLVEKEGTFGTSTMMNGGLKGNQAECYNT